MIVPVSADAAGPALPERSTSAVVVRPVRGLAEATVAGELLKTVFDQTGVGTPAYGEHLRDVGPRMTLAELLVAVDGLGAVLGCVTYARFGTPFALVSRTGEAELRMLGVSEHRRRSATERLLIEACIERAERDGCAALAMSMPRVRGRAAVRGFTRVGFRPAKGREQTPMPGLTLDVYTLPLPRSADARAGRWGRG
jgi:GNAT superfamily N-acetyltransferase